MKTLLKTLSAEKSKLFTVSNNRRVMLSDCPVEIDIYEVSTEVPVLGVVGYEVKIHYNAELNCQVKETCRPVDVDFLKTVSRYEIVSDIQREDGVFVRLVFDNLCLTHYNLHGGSWFFDVTDQNMIGKLLAF
jgi:hypothetical protein